MSKLLLLAGGILLATAGSPAPAMAEDVCENLWTSRNEIYKANGYCFRTRRAIAAFGNAGCRYDDVEAMPLSAHDRGWIADIVRQERRLGCPR